MLHHYRQLAQLGDLLLVNLVQRDEQPCLVFGKQVGQELYLVPKADLHDMSIKRVPRRPGGPEGADREVEPAEASFYGLGIEVPEQARKMLCCDSVEEPR